MTTTFSRFAFAALGVCALLAASGASAATTSVYKCFDRDLSVLYTDQPCKGEHLEVNTGPPPDPAALARLDREREVLAKAIERRLADDQQLRLARQYPTFAYAPPAYPGGDYGVDVTYPAYAPGPYYGYGYGYGAEPFHPRDAARMKGARTFRHLERQRIVPAAPRNPGRGR